MEILTLLRQVIQEHKISFRELERRTGIRRQILMDCVNGRAKPKFTTLEALFRVFGITFDMQPGPVAGKNKVTLKWKGPPPLQNKAETRVSQRGTVPTASDSSTESDRTKDKPTAPSRAPGLRHPVG